MARIVINSTAVRNNGDIALIFALERALAYRGHSVTFATPHAAYMHRIQRRNNTCMDAIGSRIKLFRLPILAEIASLAALIFVPAYRRADAVIGAPGGYVNSYYGFSWRIPTYRFSRLFGKRTAVYAQSIGPLSPKDEKSIRLLVKNLDALTTRDELSYRTAISTGCDASRIIPSVDAFFLSPPHASAYSRTSNVVAVSVREWNYDNRSPSDYARMMLHLCRILLDRGFAIEFISTCQGIPEYIDDSEMATSIASALLMEKYEEGKIQVVRDALSIEQLKHRIDRYRFVVGTRLHMCLLSLLSGVPALNISYEEKGKECYQYLGLDSYSIDYNADPNKAREALELFLSDEQNLRESIPGIVRRQHIRASRDLDLFLARLNISDAN